MPNSSNFRRMLKTVRQEQIGFQKRVLMYPMSSVEQAAKQESLLIIPLGLGTLMG